MSINFAMKLYGYVFLSYNNGLQQFLWENIENSENYNEKW